MHFYAKAHVGSGFPSPSIERGTRLGGSDKSVFLGVCSDFGLARRVLLSGNA
jgi:hypothetical protein